MNVEVNLGSRIDPAAARRLHQILFEGSFWCDDDEPTENEDNEER